MDTTFAAETLIRYVRSLPDFQLLNKMDGQYDHMGATITDAMLQAGMNYETVVRPRVRRVRDQYPQAKTTSGFASCLAAVGPAAMLNWTGVEKLGRITGVTAFFLAEGIETEGDLARWLGEPDNVERLKQLRGIGNKTADYLKILVGLPTSAVDRHLFRLLALAGINAADYNAAQTIIHRAADLLDWNRALFDHSIWKYMSTQIKSASRTSPQRCSRPT